MPNKNSLEAVKKVQPSKFETIDMIQIYRQQQWVISDCNQVLIIPKSILEAVNNIKMAIVMYGTIKVTYKVSGW